MGIELNLRRFQFSLESVLTVREKALKDAQKQLASITGVYNKQKDVLSEMITALSNLEKESEKYLEEVNFNPELIANYKSFSLKLAQDIRFQEQIIEKTRLDVLKQQNITKKAYIDVKSLENLKQKQKDEYNKELQLEELKQTDDIVNSRRN